jgi:hypothetical protein
LVSSIWPSRRFFNDLPRVLQRDTSICNSQAFFSILSAHKKYKFNDAKFKAGCVEFSGLSKIHSGHLHVIIENIPAGQFGHWRPWVVHWVDKEIRIIMFDSLPVEFQKDKTHDIIHR